VTGLSHRGAEDNVSAQRWVLGVSVVFIGNPGNPWEKSESGLEK
jgi:hypothetical protein